MRGRPNFAMVCVTAITLLLVVGLIPMAQVRELSNCLWVGPVAAGQYNAGYPDEAGVYWYAEYQLAPGAKLVLRGQFPHARYMSLNSYDGAGRPTDAINDVGTVPDPGSSNPFPEGARRRITDRSYTIEIVNEPPPAGPRLSNTLYAGVPGQATQKVLYRIFVPDKGRDVTGDTGLPQHEIRLADATTPTGQAACDAIKANPARDIPLLRLTIPVDRYRAMRDPVPNLPDTHPAFNPPDWEGYFGSPYSASRFLKGTPREAERARVAITKAGGFYSNRDVDYISAFVDRKFGSVLLLRGKAPATPRTYNDDELMGPGQVRYWSICKNESLATTRFVACLYDEQIPLDRDGYYAIAVSTEQDRPMNANAQCGVAWLNWGTTGDGLDRPTAGNLLLRHLLPSPTFAPAFRNILTPGTEAQVLGPYLPKGTYMSRQQFETRGCPVRG